MPPAGDAPEQQGRIVGQADQLGEEVVGDVEQRGAQSAQKWEADLASVKQR